MSFRRILATLPCTARTVIKSIRLDDRGLIVSCRPRKGQACRCPHCGRKRPLYDCSITARLWRALDLGTTKTFIEYATVRIKCPVHGVVAAAVPWAHHASRFTHSFEEQVAWLCVHCNRSVVAHLMRIDWKSVGPVCRRVYDRLDAEAGSRFDGLRRIGVDEASYKKGYKCMTVALNHDTGRVVWCSKGHGKAVLESFFSLLTDEQRASIEVVTADGAKWMASVVAKRCRNAGRVMGPFHVVSWMTDVLDGVRKDAWRDAKRAEPVRPKRKRGRPRKGEGPVPSKAKAVKNSRFSLLKNPDNLTDRQTETLECIAREDKRLYRAYLLKERLRDVFKTQSGEEAGVLLGSWLASACRSGIAAIRELSKKVRRHREAIIRSVAPGISNARVEAINNKIKLTVRMGYGFRNIDNLIALVMLRCSNLPIALPGRA